METTYRKKTEEVHFQHKVWMNQLAFYKEGLKIFSERLTEVASKNTNQEVHIHVEQFQNRFIIQKNEISKIEHLIHINEDEAVQTSELHIRRIDYEATEAFVQIQTAMDIFEKLYKDLKDDFYSFLGKYM
jgi:hypothetical protein